MDASRIFLYVSHMSNEYTSACCKFDFTRVAVAVGCLGQTSQFLVKAPG
jgi:hypothetical protein